jgi:nucleotide-binding universal stress UspA family protein
MSRFTNILCGIDGSPESVHAAKEALKLGGPDTVVRLLCVMPTSVLAQAEEAGQWYSDKDFLAAPFSEAIEEVEKSALESEIVVDVMVRKGQVWEVIVQATAGSQADLLVLGARKGESLRRRLLGGVHSKVVSQAECPVLVIPEDTRLETDDIMLATDGSKHSIHAQRAAINLAEGYGSRILVHSVADPDEVHPDVPSSVTAGAYAGGPGKVPYNATRTAREQTRKMMDHIRAQAERIAEEAAGTIKEACCPAETEVSEGKVWESIVSRAKDRNMGLVVMGTHGHTGLKRLFLGSVTQRVMEHAPCPVLVVR